MRLQSSQTRSRNLAERRNVDLGTIDGCLALRQAANRYLDSTQSDT